MKNDLYLFKHVELLMHIMQKRGDYFYILEGENPKGLFQHPDRVMIGHHDTSYFGEKLDTFESALSAITQFGLDKNLLFSYVHEYIELLEKQKESYIAYFLKHSVSLFGKMSLSNFLDIQEHVSESFFIRLLAQGAKSLCSYEAHALHTLFETLKPMKGGKEALIQYLKRQEKMFDNEDMVMVRDAILLHFDQLDDFASLSYIQDILHSKEGDIFLEKEHEKTYYIRIDFRQAAQSFIIENGTVEKLITAFGYYLEQLENDNEIGIHSLHFLPNFQNWDASNYSYSELFFNTSIESNINDTHMQQRILAFLKACQKIGFEQVNVAQHDAFVYALGRAIAKNELDEKLSPTRTVQRKKI